MVSCLHPYFQEEVEGAGLVEDVLQGVQAVMEVAYPREVVQEGEACQADLQHLQEEEAYLVAQSPQEEVEHWEWLHWVRPQTADGVCLPGREDSELQADVQRLIRDALPVVLFLHILQICKKN